jgi:hypothetical protein
VKTGKPEENILQGRWPFRSDLQAIKMYVTLLTLNALSPTSWPLFESWPINWETNAFKFVRTKTLRSAQHRLLMKLAGKTLGYHAQ